MRPDRPELSVVLPTDTVESIRRTLRHLRAQSVRERIELVLVAPSAAAIGLGPADREPFWDVQVVEASIDSLYGARAAGIRAAHAPVVVLAETHSFPHPAWAESLIQAHAGPWAAVGPALESANPDSLIAWTNLFLDYGPWVDARTGGPTDDLPGHNSSFKRDLLVAYGDQLGEILRSEILLFADLRANGHAFYFEPAARTDHLNVSLPSAWLPERFAAGRMYAAARSRSWSRAKRLSYCVGAPLIPFVRLRRVLKQIQRSGRARQLLPQILPSLGVALVASAAGESLGYARGVGDAARAYHEAELHRLRFVQGSERWTN